MAQAIRQRVTVGPHGRVEVPHSDLPEGRSAEVIVQLDDDAAADQPPVTLTSLLGSARGLYGKSAEEMDRHIRELRDEWER